MEWMKRTLNFLTILLSISLALIGVIFVILIISGTISLITLGNILLFLGMGIIILGFAIINFRRTPVDIHVRHQGDQEQKRQKVQTDLAEYNIGFAIVLVGLILSASGWLMMHVAICGRLFCG